MSGGGRGPAGRRVDRADIDAYDGASPAANRRDPNRRNGTMVEFRRDRRHRMANDRQLRVIIAGGGTGGHLYPGIAVARELLSRMPAAEISFAGTQSGIEARVVPKEGFPLDCIRSQGLKGKSLSSRLRGLTLIVPSLLDAWALVSKRRPHLVIGVGGYSSGPVVLMAALRRVPTMLLEQNAMPGLTNRLLAPFVGAAALTYPSTTAMFGPRAFVSGNPVRPELFEAAGVDADAGHEAGAIANVLVFGGSQGAHAINVAMVEAAHELAAHGSGLRLTHQTGARDLEMVREAYGQAGLEADIAPYYDDMAVRIQRADLVVSRAGASTLAELTAAGKAAILVPLPTAADDHQRRNAEAMAEAGAAELLPQSSLSGPLLAERILSLARHADSRARMAGAARALARPDAARVIVDRALALARPVES
jgi:UDP-N-acetylglucosamine--N-acetylmuramyl-(pentapeptide) pyrophosphoryl-undecaprenol N-acetylglucosamine transferase